MKRVELAVQMFDEGYSCAQSLLGAFAPQLGMSRDLALRVAAPFGGGMSRTDGVCGAASGALMVLGLAQGYTAPDDQQTKNSVRELTQQFLRRYRDREGSTMCTDILGHDLSQPGVADRVKAAGLNKPSCPNAVRTASEILVELLDDGPLGT